MKKQLLWLTLALGGSLSAQADGVLPVLENGQTSVVKKMTKGANFISVKSAADQNCFYEDFEDWNGGNNSWLPRGWSDESKVGHTEPTGWYDQDLTWQLIGNGDVMIPVYEGQASAYIMASNYYSNTPFEEQDEWLITPSISVREKDNLYFYMHYSPSYTLYNHDNNDFSSVNSHLEVWVTENGTDWSPLWSVVDEVKKMSEEELRADLISDNLDYTPFYIDLKDYGNKKVQFAFRYTGSHGRDIAIDNVAVGLPVPTTYYLAPLSAMYVGLSPDVTMPQTPYMVLPDHAEDSWEHVSSSYNAVKWTYIDAQGQTAESTETVLTTPAYNAPALIEAPTVQAFFNASASETYQSDYSTMQIGGSAFGYADVAGKTYDYYGLANYNCLDPNVEVKFNRTIGFDENSIDKWCGLLGLTPYGFEVRAIANFYGQPASPYVLRNGYLSLYVEKLRPEAEIKMVVRKIDEQGVPAEIVSEAVCLGKDVIIPTEPAYTHAYFEFKDPIVIDYPVLVEVTGFSVFDDAVYIPSLFTNTVSNVAPAYMSLDTETGPVYFPLSDLRGFTDNAHIAGIAMSLGAEYPWFATSGETEVVEAGAEGLTQTVTVETSTRPDDLVIETSAEWITTKAVSYDIEKNQAQLTLQVAQNKGAERTATLKISTVGVDHAMVYDVKQAGVVSAVESVTVEEQVRVSGHQLLLQSACSSVNLYNASGMKVGSYALNGHDVIDMSGWNKGVYILQFSNGHTVKVLR